MQVKLVKLTDLRKLASSVQVDGFREAYPGGFLLAMGFLSAEVIRSRRNSSEIESQKIRPDETTAISFSSHLKHDAKAPHPLAGYAFFLAPTEQSVGVLIGRGKHCDLTVPEQSISDEHCRIEITDKGVVAIDVGSTNGTSVNLERLRAMTPSVLADEDILTVGRYSFQLLTADTMYAELRLLQELEA